MEQNTETRNKVNPHAYDQVILDKIVKNTKWSVFFPSLFLTYFKSQWLREEI